MPAAILTCITKSMCHDIVTYIYIIFPCSNVQQKLLASLFYLCFVGQLESMNGITISKEGAIHKLIMKNCQGDNAGVYRFEAEGRKSEATLIIKGKNNK